MAALVRLWSKGKETKLSWVGWVWRVRRNEELRWLWLLAFFGWAFPFQGHGELFSDRVIFRFDRTFLKTPRGPRQPASRLLQPRKSPLAFYLQRPSFLSPRRYPYFDGSRSHVHDSPAITVGSDHRSSFTLELVFFPTSLSGERIVFSNWDEKTGFLFGVDDGEYFLKASMDSIQTNSSEKTRVKIFAERFGSARLRNWQHLVVIGREVDKGFSFQFIRDGKLIHESFCKSCGGIRQSGRRPVVGAESKGKGGFLGLIELVALKNYSESLRTLTGVMLTPADGLAENWNLTMRVLNQKLPSLRGGVRRLWTPFSNEGYFPGPMDREGDEYYLSLHDRGKKRPTLILQLRENMKIRKVFSLKTSEDTEFTGRVDHLMIHGGTLWVGSGNKIREFPLRKKDLYYHMAQSDWLESHLDLFLDPVQSSRNPVDLWKKKDLSKPSRVWSHTRIRASGREWEFKGRGRIKAISSTDSELGTLPVVWVEAQGGSGLPEIRAYRLTHQGPTSFERTEHFFLLPKGFNRQLALHLMGWNEKKKEAKLYVSHRTSSGYPIHRLQPWGKTALEPIFVAPFRVGYLHRDTDDRRIWFAPHWLEEFPMVFGLGE